MKCLKCKTDIVGTVCKDCSTDQEQYLFNNLDGLKIEEILDYIFESGQFILDAQILKSVFGDVLVNCPQQLNIYRNILDDELISTIINLKSSEEAKDFLNIKASYFKENYGFSNILIHKSLVALVQAINKNVRLENELLTVIETEGKIPSREILHIRSKVIVSIIVILTISMVLVLVDKSVNKTDELLDDSDKEMAIAVVDEIQETVIIEPTNNNFFPKEIIINEGSLDHSYSASSVVMDSDKFVVGINRNIYIYDLSKQINDIGYETKITSDNDKSSDSFGGSIAISGNKVVVGAHMEDNNGSSSGSIYIYDLRKIPGTAGYKTKITPSDGEDWDMFGYSVAIDGTKVVVGAYGDDDKGLDSGSVYVYDITRKPGSTGHETKIMASNGVSRDFFGSTVAIEGDIVVVGAYGDDEKGEESGCIYIYDLTKKPGTTGYETKVIPNDGEDVHWFGYSVVMDFDKVVVRAYGNGENGEESGSIYIYDLTKNPGDFGYETKKKPYSNSLNDLVKYSIAIDAEKVVVGVYGIHDRWGNPSFPGSIFIYDLGKQPEEIDYEIKITENDSSRNPWFGNVVAISGDKVIVSARQDYNENAYLYYKIP
ncbi:hypothetical protein RJG79_07500 [Mycoplasmatota bacterium WC44]